jgi:hypothetical protein
MSVLVPPCVFEKVAAILAREAVGETPVGRAIATSTLWALSRTSTLLYEICTFRELPIWMDKHDSLHPLPEMRERPIWFSTDYMPLAMDNIISVNPGARIEGVRSKARRSDYAEEEGLDSFMCRQDEHYYGSTRIEETCAEMPNLKFLCAIACGGKLPFPKTLVEVQLCAILVKEDVPALVGSLPAKTLRVLELDFATLTRETADALGRGNAGRVMASLRRFLCSTRNVDAAGMSVVISRLASACKRAYVIKFNFAWVTLPLVDVDLAEMGSPVYLPHLRKFNVFLPRVEVFDELTGPMFFIARSIGAIVQGSPLLHTLVLMSEHLQVARVARVIGSEQGLPLLPMHTQRAQFDVTGTERVIELSELHVNIRDRKLPEEIIASNPRRLRRIFLSGDRCRVEKFVDALPGLRSVRLDYGVELGRSSLAYRSPCAWAARLDELDVHGSSLPCVAGELLVAAVSSVHTLTLRDSNLPSARLLPPGGAPRLQVLKLYHCVPSPDFWDAIADGKIPRLVYLNFYLNEYDLPFVFGDIDYALMEKYAKQIANAIAACRALAVVKIDVPRVRSYTRSRVCLALVGLGRPRSLSYFHTREIDQFKKIKAVFPRVTSDSYNQ